MFKDNLDKFLKAIRLKKDEQLPVQFGVSPYREETLQSLYELAECSFGALGEWDILDDDDEFVAIASTLFDHATLEPMSYEKFIVVLEHHFYGLIYPVYPMKKKMFKITAGYGEPYNPSDYDKRLHYKSKVFKEKPPKWISVLFEDTYSPEKSEVNGCDYHCIFDGLELFFTRNDILDDIPFCREDDEEWKLGFEFFNAHITQKRIINHIHDTLKPKYKEHDYKDYEIDFLMTTYQKKIDDASEKTEEFIKEYKKKKEYDRVGVYDDYFIKTISGYVFLYFLAKGLNLILMDAERQLDNEYAQNEIRDNIRKQSTVLGKVKDYLLDKFITFVFAALFGAIATLKYTDVIRPYFSWLLP